MFDNKDHEARARTNELMRKINDLQTTVDIIKKALTDDPKMIKAVQDYAYQKLFEKDHQPKPILFPLDE